MLRLGPALASALPFLLLGLCACEKDTAGGCPGETLAQLSLHGTLDPDRTGCAVPPEGGWVVDTGLPDDDPATTFGATLAYDGATGVLAYCSGGAHAASLTGTLDGGHVEAQVTLPGAVLGACSAACMPLLTVAVSGDLVGASGANPPSFTGTLVETFHDSDGSCGDCQLPCTSTYALVSVSQAQP